MSDQTELEACICDNPECRGRAIRWAEGWSECPQCKSGRMKPVEIPE